jgi:tetratricopeptide (TPR) repeat protein
MEGQLEEAEPHFQTAAAIYPADPVSTVNIASYELQHDHLQAAVSGYNKTIALAQDARLKAVAFTSLGSIYSRLKDLPRARESFEAAVILRPRTIRAWMGLGLVAEKSNDFDTAVRAFSKACAVQPSDVEYLLLAHALEQSGHQEQALAATEEAKRLTDNFEQAQQFTRALLAQ